MFTPVLGERGVIVKGNAIFTLVTRAHFCRAVMMWGGSIRENEFLIFWLACLDVAISLRVISPTSSDARHIGGEWMLACKLLYFAYPRSLCRMLRRSGVSMPLHFPSAL